MKIMVFDVPAELGGALSILHEYYHKAVNHEDKDIQWIFVLSTPDLEETDNIKVLRYPWIKKSWFHRLYFDYFIAHKLVKKYQVDEILSLQNIIIPRVKNIKQTLYVHQSLPFVDHKFKLREDRKMWLYQNIIGRLIFNSIQKADRVIVQTKWMKKACIESTGIHGSKIEVRPPKVKIEVNKPLDDTSNRTRTFFYPAGGCYYKNHRVIVEACESLTNEGVKDFEVIFTLKDDENKHISNLYKKVQEEDLPIKFIGTITKNEVFKYYGRSILLFPSYIETFGLPLLEARVHNNIIIASNCNFSKEVLQGYKNKYYFNPFNSKQLSMLMRQILTDEDD